jgi:ribosome-associated heat shock protein Hsp15
VRLDKWLWAARLYKTRALAAEAVALGRIEVNELPAKPSRELRVADRVHIRQGPLTRELEVLGLSMQRGPASVAVLLYEESAASIAAREAFALRRRQGVEPADTLAHGRPTKRDRRELVDWNRWSASLDETPPDSGS